MIGIDISSAQGILTDAHWAEIAKTKRFALSDCIECALGAVAISCWTAPTRPSFAIELTVILLPP